MAKRSIPKGVVKDIIIVAVGVLVIWIGLQVVFGTQSPFYVVASGSMEPVLYKHDVIIVQGHEPFKDIEVGEIVVFTRPSDNNKDEKKVIVHRVASITDEDPKTIRTKGDANPGSIAGTDFPITDKEYIGKVEYILPQIGYFTQLLKPPINFIIIGVVIGVMVLKHFVMKKNEKEIPFTDSSDSINPETKELSDINKIEKDSEYSEHVEKSDNVEELDDTDEPENQTKTEGIDETFEGIEESIDDETKKDDKPNNEEK